MICLLSFIISYLWECAETHFLRKQVMRSALYSATIHRLSRKALSLLAKANFIYYAQCAHSFGWSLNSDRQWNCLPRPRQRAREIEKKTFSCNATRINSRNYRKPSKLEPFQCARSENETGSWESITAQHYLWPTKLYVRLRLFLSFSLDAGRRKLGRPAWCGK